MKVEQLLVQYLYKNKTVNIQDIGSFQISPDVVFPSESDKDISLPEGAIQFTYDKKTPADDGLINYIVEQSGKIRPLAASDLESYSILTRQFLNIGKPLPIEGLGILQKNQQGNVDFIQGATINTKTEAPHTVVKEKSQDEISFASPAKKTASRSGWMVGILIVFLLCVGAAVYYFMTREKEVPVSEQPVVMTDSSGASDSIPPAVIDSMLRKDSATAATKPADGSSFKIVIKEFNNRAAAQKAFDKFTTYGHKLQIIATDSTKFKMAMPFTSPISDTLRAKDSLRRFFGGNPYVEL
ncbi:MAG: hypothetical protein EOO06_04005 [Chitinophagaceae bacterium]|nr:MAG: hypothetical protein EOO06_04005 [Chitinophagaceae bacterium]